MISVDANILVYSVDVDDAPRQQGAIDLLAAAARTGAVLTEQSLIEFVNVSSKTMELPLERIRAVVQGWLASFAVLTPGPTAVSDTLELLSRYNLSTWDAHMLAVCSRAGCTTLISEDMQDGAFYDGVQVVNPFASKNARLLADLLI